MNRIIEWALAVSAAVLCLIGTAQIGQAFLHTPGVTVWPFPALVLIDVAGLGLVGFVGAVLNSNPGSGWGVLSWLASGGLTGLALLGIFTISAVVFAAMPALLLASTAMLADVRHKRNIGRGLGILVVSAVANLSLVLLFFGLARV